jgi:hypothetical protein
MSHTVLLADVTRSCEPGCALLEGLPEVSTVLRPATDAKHWMRLPRTTRQSC